MQMISLLLVLAMPGASVAREALDRAEHGRRSDSAQENAAAAGAAPGTLDLPPQFLSQYIATGYLPVTATQAASRTKSCQTPPCGAFLQKTVINDPDPDPYEEQAEHILANLSEYSERLKAAGAQAEKKLQEVQEQEEKLSQQFLPRQKVLADSIKNAANEAAKAEATTMLERLTRVHYDQVATLDRSARFWEEHIAREKELTRAAEAKARLEDSAREAVKFQKHARAVNEQELLEVEQARMQDWLKGYETQLTEQEKAVQQEVLASGGGFGPQAAAIGNLRKQVIEKVQEAAQSPSLDPLPTV